MAPALPPLRCLRSRGPARAGSAFDMAAPPFDPQATRPKKALCREAALQCVWVGGWVGVGLRKLVLLCLTGRLHVTAVAY